MLCNFDRYIVVFSLERLIVVKFPMKRFIILTERRNKMVTKSLWLFSILFYSYSIFITDIQDDTEIDLTYCHTTKRWLHLATVMAVFDAILTICIPMLLIIVANILICYELVRSKEVVVITSRPNATPYSTNIDAASVRSGSPTVFTRQSLQSDRVNLKTCVQRVKIAFDNNRNSVSIVQEKTRSSKQIDKARSNTNSSIFFKRLPSEQSLNENFEVRRERYETSNLLARSIQLKRLKNYSKTTRTLIIISVTYILLNTLMAISKLKYLIDFNLIYDNTTTTSVEHNSTSTHLTNVYSHILFHNSTLSSNTSDALNDLVDNNELKFISESELNTQLIERISNYLYSLNYSINFFLYVFTSSEFRKKMLKLFRS